MESINLPVEENVTETQESPAAPNPQPVRPIKMTPILKYLLIFLGVLLVLLILIFLFKPRTLPGTENNVSPAPVPVASQYTPLPRQLSEFAQTEAFTHFEKGLDDLIAAQENVDLIEPQLTFPVVEMNVNYQNE